MIQVEYHTTFSVLTRFYGKTVGELDIRHTTRKSRVTCQPQQ